MKMVLSLLYCVFLAVISYTCDLLYLFELTGPREEGEENFRGEC